MVGREQRLAAAQVAVAFLAHGADEQQVAGGPDALLVERAQHLQQHGEAARVVGDAGPEAAIAVAAHLDVGAGGKHGVEVGGEHEARAATGAGAHADHIALGVDANVGEAKFPQAAGEVGGAHFLVEGRRLDLGERDLVGERDCVVALDGGERRLERGRGDQLRHRVFGLRQQRRQIDRRGGLGWRVHG